MRFLPMWRFIAPLGRILAFIAGFGAQSTGQSAHEWDSQSLSAEQRADLVLAQLTQAEKLSLVHGGLGAPWGGQSKPNDAIGSAGYIPGVPRLGVPALQETDAELGIANPGNIRPGETATAMPSDLALASTWDADLARTSSVIRMAAEISNIFPKILCSRVSWPAAPSPGCKAGT
jgi:beta-glucosidase-like glycosyl hydrolase